MLGLPVPQKMQIVRRVIEGGYDVTEADGLRERFRKEVIALL